MNWAYVKYGSIWAVVLFGVMLGLGYDWAVKSAPYALTKQFVQSSPEIRDALGQTSSVVVDPISIGQHTVGDDGTAKFAVWVRGDQRSGRVSLKFVERQSVWAISEARLNGRWLRVGPQS